MHKTFLSTLLVGLLTVVGVSSVWAGVESWSFTNQYQRKAWPRAVQTAGDISYNNGAWPTLGDWGGNTAANMHVSGDHGDAHMGTASGNSAEVSILIYKHTKNIPAYCKYVRTATFYLYYASNFFYHGFGLYLFDNESTAKSTPLDVSREKNQPYGNAYLIKKGWSSDLSGNHGSINGNKTITYDNSTNSAAKDISKYIDLTHTTTDGDHVEKNGIEWVTWKETASSNETWYYYKHFTFKANEGTGTAMAVQSIANSGNLTTNTYTREGYSFTGWNTAADGTGTAYTNGQAITATSSDKGEITLYAQWSQNPVVLDQAVDNSTVISYAATTYSKPIAVSLSRSQFAGGMYNTVCFPFAMTAAQIETAFGADCEVQSLSSSQIQGNDLHINFEQVTAMEAGKPYLIMPASDISVSSISGVTVSATAPVDVETTNATFKGLFNPSAAFAAGDKHILFVTSGNTLNYPSNNGSIAGMRAYLLLTGDAVAKTPTRCLLNAGGKNTPTAIETPSPLGEGRGEAFKLIERGQVILIINGEKYNVQGVKL